MSQSFIGFNFKGGYLGFIMVVITIRDPVHNSEFSSVWVPSAFHFVKAYLGFKIQVISQSSPPSEFPSAFNFMKAYPGFKIQVNSIHISEFATVWVPSAFNFMKAYLGFKIQMISQSSPPSEFLSAFNFMRACLGFKIHDVSEFATVWVWYFVLKRYSLEVMNNGCAPYVRAWYVCECAF